MTPRIRRKPFVMPPLTCQIAGCGAEYAAIGDYADTLRAAELGGWRYCIFDDNGSRLIGAWVCPDHRHVLPWWPGRRLAPPLPVRDPGATTAEFLGVVPGPEPLPLEAAIGGRVLGTEATETGLTVRIELPEPEPDLDPLPAPRSHAAGDFTELSPEALKRGVPLQQLAPEQEGEADV